MKYESEVKKIKANAAKIAELDELVKNTHWSERNAPEIVKAAERAELLRVENAIRHDNARRLFVEELTPAALDALREYAGRPYGDKTREKIGNNFHARTGHRFYIDQNNYHCRISFVELNAAGYSGIGYFRYNETDAETIYSSSAPALLTAENKINPEALKPENFRVVYCNAYDASPAKTAREIVKENKKLEAQRAALESACSAYNKKIPSNMKSANLQEYGRFSLFK